MTVAGLSVDGLQPDAERVVTTYGGRRHTLTGKVVGSIPAGVQLWVMTSPPHLQNRYLQGRIVPGRDGAWSVTVNVGRTDDQPQKFPDPVTIFAVSDPVGSYLLRCGGTVDQNPVIPPGLPFTKLGMVTIRKLTR
ncbi:hypothetical protein [Frankia canadensis]|uniref:hypothetical protein n=1 Tax=Frankia canadensis TaxID=1836972 RepID=UPI001055D0B8|nr:hypothetical protein [Frankia canadensis]